MIQLNIHYCAQLQHSIYPSNLISIFFPLLTFFFSYEQLLTTYILCFIQLLTRINLNAARCDRRRTVQKYIQSVCWILKVFFFSLH